MTPPEHEFAREADEAWAPLRTAAARLAEAGRLDERTASGWTVKGMLSHVAFWDETTAVVVAMLLRGGPFPEHWPGFASGYDPPEDHWPDAAVHNDREAAWGEAQPADAVLQRLDQAHEQSLAVLAGTTPDEVADERFRRFVLGERVDHYAQHAAELNALLGDV